MRVGLEGRAIAQAVSRALATRKSGFDRRSVRVRIVVGIVALSQVFSVCRFSAVVSVTFVYVHVAVTGQTDEAWLQTKQCSSDGYQGAMDREAVSCCVPPSR
jgi:hypothetical protein